MPVDSMSSEQILAALREHKRLIAPDALLLLSSHASPHAVLGKLLESSDAVVITLERTQQVIDELATASEAAAVEVIGSTSFTPPSKDVEAAIEFYPESDVTGKSRCTGTVDDFVSCFRDRFARAGRLLRSRASELETVSVSGVKDRLQNKPCRMVAMVMDKRVTKNGHTLIEVEDEESSLPCLVSKSATSELKQSAANLLPDEVVAFEGRLSNTLFIVDKIVWPDIPYSEKKLIDEDISIAFLSDLHVGSKFFLQNQFTEFLKFLTGEGIHGGEKEAAGKIKYLCLAGDLIDGIGIYPSQERELVTKDVYTQYEIFCEFIKHVPEHIHVIISPGNHDAVRGGQPQPRILPEFLKGIEGYSNLHFVGSPSQFSLHGLRTLIYHGDSAFSFIGSVESLSGAYTSPEKIGIEWLKRRHVSPLYGDNPIIPEKKDYLFIDTVPDILHFGHLHRNGYASYRGTTVVNAGAWQDVTDYQLKQGFVPTPGKLPIYSVNDGSMRIIEFM